MVHRASDSASANGLVLGQRKRDDKSNEIAAIAMLIEALELSGTFVAFDAMAEEIDCGHGLMENCAGAVIADTSLVEQPTQ